ncbi:MAG: S8 family serine peptidase, partial [Patescibacteria group bacterium]
LGRVGEGYNFFTNSTIPADSNSDDNGHGTAVAGVIGATTNNSKGMAGINWQARLVPLKVTNALGEATTTRVANAIMYAADLGTKTINLSLGTNTDFEVFHDAISYAANKGVVMVGAAGNDSGGQVLFPAANPSVIAVGSVAANDVVSNFSNTGPELDLVAPGENILSTVLSGDQASYATGSGTSFAAPYVTGIASLVAIRFPSLTPTQIQNLLQDQADKPIGMAGQNFHNSYGYGRVNAARAISIHAGWVSQNSYPTLRAGQSYQFEVRLLNSGASVWTQQTIRLGADQAADRIPAFIREDRVGNQGSGWLSGNRVALVESQVSPGQTGTFRFYYTVPADRAPGVYREYFRPVAEQISWLENIGIFWDVTVQTLADTYRTSWVSQNSYPTLLAGQSNQFEVQVRNDGTSTWQKGTVSLGTDRVQNRIPPFIREDRVGNQGSGWSAANRVELVENSVGPGQTGTFRFFYTVPADRAPGTYREYFRVVAEHITWLDDLGIYWDIQVNGSL